MRVQVASGEWVLGIEIQQFVNSLNATMKNGKYCCCDIAASCREVASALGKCPAQCDTTFLIHIPACDTEMCPSSWQSVIIYDSPSVLDLSVGFALTMQSNSVNQVRDHLKHIY